MLILIIQSHALRRGHLWSQRAVDYAEGCRTSPGYYWQNKFERVRLMEIIKASKNAALKIRQCLGRKAWVPRNGPGRSIEGRF